MKRARNILGGLLGLLLLAALAVGVGALLRTTGQPSTAAGPPPPTLPVLPTPQVSPTSPFSPTLPVLATPAVEEPTPVITGVAESPRGILYAAEGTARLQPVDESGQRAAPATDLSPGLRTTGPLFLAPDSRHVAAIEGVEGGDLVTIVDAHTGESWPLLRDFNRDGSFLNWFPDSRRVLFWTDVGPGPVGLLAIDVFSGDVRQLVDTEASERVRGTVDGAASSPDGKRVVFAARSCCGAPGGVWSVSADGSNLQLLHEGEPPMSMAATHSLTWSPDGGLIAYVGKDDADNYGLCVMAPDGTNRRLLSERISQGWGFLPVWSLDSRTIAYVARELPEEKPQGPVDWDLWAMKGNNVHLVDVETGEEWRLVPDSQEGNVAPTWSPDGSMVAFVSNRSGAPEIWVVGVDGAGLQQLTDDGQVKRTPVWLAGGEQ